MASALGNVLPSLYNPSSAHKFILDLAFRDCAVILRESLLLKNEKMNGFLPFPLVGFTFDTPSNIQLLKYNYCEYPYLNKTMIVNSLVKENNEISITGSRPITRGNSIIMNTVLNQVLVKALEIYASRGGTFILITMWGIIQDLVLEELAGKPTDGGVGGVLFDFKFKKINFVNMKQANKVSDNVLGKASGSIV